VVATVSEITLRPLREEDLEWFHSVRNNPETFKFLHQQRAFSLEETRDWFRNEEPLYWIVYQSGIAFGYFRTQQIDAVKGSIQIGMDIAPEFRGKGLAVPSYEKFIGYLESKLFHTFSLEVLSDNIRAIHLYEGLGFEEISRSPYPTAANQANQSVHMKRSLSETKGVKVIPFYFGDRRQWPVGERDSQHVHGLLNFVLEKEVSVDPGLPCDTILVVNECGEGDKVTNPKWYDYCNELIDMADGNETKRGVIKVIRRQNVGVSFASYDAAFHQFAADYDVWFFCEDDQVVLEDDIFSDAVEVLRDLKRNVGFVAAVGLANNPVLHAHGGCGVTTCRVLQKSLEEAQTQRFKDHMEYQIRSFNERATDWQKGHKTTTEFLGRKHLPWYYPSSGSGFGLANKETEILGEVAFTNIIQFAGYTLVNHPRKKFLVNWKNAGHDRRSGLWKDGILRNCHGEAVRLVPYERWMDSATELG
jgi:ribosomal protein S18 acetylase RimI-like enzyme